MSTSSPSTAVSLDQVVSLIGRFPALAGMSLEVAGGETVLIEGPNGAGKSTLLRVVAGLAPIHQGTAHVVGLDLTQRRQRAQLRRQVGYVGHHNGLYGELTVEENVRFWANANRVALERVEPALERLGLAGRLRSVPVRGLSAGQRRRCALAVVVCRRPMLWLLDEPHAGLDAEGRDLVDDLVRQAVASGATALISSHEHDRSSALASRIVTIAGGQVQHEREVGQ